MWTVLLVVAMVLVVGVAVVAAIVVAQLQKQGLRRTLRLEIVNKGNVPSRYELRAEDPQGVLAFEFSLGGDPLPVSEQHPAEPKAAAPAAATPPPAAGGWILPAEGDKLKKGTQTAMSASGEAADALGALGMLLPRSLRDPLLRTASGLRRGRGAAVKVQNLSKRTGRLPKKPVGGGEAAPALSGEPSPGPVWVQTPSLPPGESLTVDLLIRLVGAAGGPNHLFQIVSRAVGQEDALAVATEGQVHIARPPLLRRLLPYGLIAALTTGILALLGWLLVGLAG